MPAEQDDKKEEGKKKKGRYARDTLLKELLSPKVISSRPLVNELGLEITDYLGCARNSPQPLHISEPSLSLDQPKLLLTKKTRKTTLISTREPSCLIIKKNIDSQ